MSTTIQTTQQQRTVFTRHYGIIVIGIISSVISALGTIQGHIPDFSQYLQATAIPGIITIADFIAARLKDQRGLAGLSLQDMMMVFEKIKEIKDKFPSLKSSVALPAASATVTGSIKIAPTVKTANPVQTVTTPGPQVPAAIATTMPKPSFTVNFVPTPDGTTHGIKQGDDIIVENSNGPDYMFYGFLQATDGTFASVTWDEFNDGAKDGILVIHTQKSVKSPDGSKQVDVPIPTGTYNLVLRDDPTPTGNILGETDYFTIF
jgi:hypothetical protein